MPCWRIFVGLYHNLFNLKFAVISAVFNGALVMAVNGKHGLRVLLMAGLAQAVSSFFSTGVTARLVQHFSPLESVPGSYLLGSCLPAALTLLLSLGAHFLNHTPELLASCLPATAVSFVTSFGTNFITRRGYLRPPNYPN